MAQDKVLQVSQIGIEAALTPGTEVDAGTILHAFSFGMAREGGALSPFRPEGYRSNVLTRPTNRESATIPVEAVACYRGLTWLFDSLLFAATVAESTLENLLDDSSDPTKAWQRTYEFDANAVATARNTYTIEHGDSTLASLATFMVFSSFGLTLNREDVALATGAFASKKSDGATLTSTPTEIEVVPILASQGLAYLEDAEGDLATATAVAKLVAGVGSRYSTGLGNLVGTTGTIGAATDSTSRMIKVIQAKETELSDHLTTVKARYVKQFTSLDTLISKMNSTSTYLTQQLANLPGYSSSSN